MLRAVSPDVAGKLGTWQSLRAVVGSWRLLAVALLSFSSGLPLGLVWIAIPTWLKQAGVDIRVVGLLTLAQAPWSFKVLWSPLMDRFGVPGLPRKRGWVLVSQLALLGLGLALASVADRPQDVWTIAALSFAIAFASATQDIAYDGYTVEVLRPEEHAAAVAARTALYRAAMLVSGGIAITLASPFDLDVGGAAPLHWPGSWRIVHALMALGYLPCMVVTWLAPEPAATPGSPRTLREAVWGPLLGLLSQRRALDILAFVVLYKLSDQLTQALTRPFLVEVGFGPFDVGVATATIGQGAAVAGTVLGALLSQRLGLGRALWIFGLLQIGSNLGYAAVAQVGTNRPLMYGAQGFEHLASGMGSGAFGVLLLRLTQKRFSSTQFALLASLFTLPRVLAGPPAGLLADALGWRDFFILTVFAGIPGLAMLQRFAPWGMREPELGGDPAAPAEPDGARSPWGRAGFAALVVGTSGLLALATLRALRDLREGRPFDMLAGVRALLTPGSVSEWVTSLGLAVAALLGGLATAAAHAARRAGRTRRDRPKA